MSGLGRQPVDVVGEQRPAGLAPAQREGALRAGHEGEGQRQREQHEHAQQAQLDRMPPAHGRIQAKRRSASE
jgi:hypothetical protein